MPDRFARCLNTDYCSLADRRLVLRLAEDESFYCPECARPLTQAPPWGKRRAPWAVLGAVGMAGAAVATCLLVVENWPGTMAYVPTSLAPAVSTALAFFAPAAPPPPDLIAIISGTAPADTLPTPQQFLVAATMDSWLPHQAGDHVLRRRHPRPPRTDPAATAARTALEAGVPPSSGLDETDAGANMPWRQALIMAALVTPGPMPMAQPALPPTAPPLTQPSPPAPSSPPPDPAPAIKPHASLINPPAETDAEHKLELALADGFIRGIRQDDARLTDQIVPPAPAPPPAQAAASTLTAIAHTALLTPRTPETVVSTLLAIIPAAKFPTPKTEVASSPNGAHKPPGSVAAALAKNTTTHPTTKKIASARIPEPRPTVAANMLAPLHRVLSQSAVAPPVATPAPAKPEAASNNAPPATPTPAPHPTSVMLANGFTGLKYGALKDADLQSIPTVAATEKLTGGSMMVDCAVPASGVPTDCKLLQSDKSPAVAHAVLAMLTSGLVHKTPKSDHGRLLRQSWPINFPASPPHRAETLEPEDQTP